MFLFIILLIQIVQPEDNSTVVEFQIVEEVSSACRCAQILSESDCIKKCYWINSTDGYTGKCRDALCTDYNETDTCNSSPRQLCYFNETTKSCEKLRGSCSDFIKEQCNIRSETCLWDETTNCTDIPTLEEDIICIDIQNEAICNSSIETNSGYFCAWNATLNDSNARILQTLTYNSHKESITIPSPPGYCTRFPITKCSDIDSLDTDDYTKKQLCDRNAETCRYTSTSHQIISVADVNVTQITYSCQQKSCGDYGTAALCYEKYLVPDFSGNKKYLCRWNSTNNTCLNGIFTENYTSKDDNKTKFFTKDNCYTEETLYQLTWDQNKSYCTQCPGIGQVLSAFLAFYILII